MIFNSIYNINKKKILNDLNKEKSIYYLFY